MSCSNNTIRNSLSYSVVITIEEPLYGNNVTHDCQKYQISRSMSGGQKTFELVIDDPETLKQYKLCVSYDDYLRAHTDEAFANALLFHARCNKRNYSNVRLVEEISVEQEDSEAEENSKSTRLFAIWTYNQTRDLIHSMGNHIDDFNHPRKRKHVYELVTNDLISNGYDVNITMVQNKWRSLNRSYNKAKDSKKTTGVGPTRFQFYDLLDEILGDKPTNSCSHSLNSIENVQPELSQTENIPSTSSTDLHTTEFDEEEINLEIHNDTKRKCKKQGENKVLDKEYLDMKKEEYKNRQKRHAERVQLQKDKMALDKKKLELLQLLLNK